MAEREPLLERPRRGRHLVPVVCPISLYTYGPLHDMFGEYVRDGWRLERFQTRRFETEAEARSFAEKWR